MITKFDNLTYYEILDIPVNASHFEVRQAYKEALSTYDGDALITYSLFSEEERNRILRKIEKAYLTLIDEEKREEYEQFLLKNGRMDPTLRGDRNTRKAVPLFSNGPGEDTRTLLNRIKEKIQAGLLKPEAAEILSKACNCGEDLEKTREFFGIERQEVFEITRINVTTLTALEGDDFEKLPPAIYLRSFLKAYAELLDLDPKNIIEGYLENMTLHQQTGKR